MKKLLVFILLITTVFFVGCSSEDADQEIENGPESNLEDNNEQNDILIKDNDKVYEFISEKYPNMYTREDFDIWQASYLDVDLDGNDDLVFTTNYYEGNLDNIIFITLNNGEYNEISSDIELAKYENRVEMGDKLIKVYRKSGGSGISTEVMGLYIFDANEIVDTDTQLIMEDVSSTPNDKTYILEGDINTFVLEGDMEDNLLDFIYTATTEIENHKTGDMEISVEKTRYIFDEQTLKYNKEDLGTEKKVMQVKPKTEPKTEEPKTEISKPKKPELSYSVKNGSVFLVKNGEELEVYNPINTVIYKDDGYGEFMMESGSSQDALARSASLSDNKKRLYFTTNSESDGYFNTAATLYLDVETEKVYFVGVGAFIRHITESPYSNYTIVATEYEGSINYSVYNDENQECCELGSILDEDIVNQISRSLEAGNSDEDEEVDYRLSGFTAETINNEYIDYSEYVAVIIPRHDTINQSALTREVCSFSDNINNIKLTFSVFGEMKDVKVNYYDSMNAPVEVENIGSLENAYLDIYASFSTDMSYVKVTGKVHEGEGYYSDVEFTMDDMRDISEYSAYRY